MLSSQRTLCSESRAFGWRLLSRTPKLCKVRSCRTLYHSHTNTGNNAAHSGFCTGGWLFTVSVLEAAAIWRNLKNRKNAPPDSSTVHVAYQSENALQREPGVRVAITEQNAEALQGSLLQNTYRIPTQIQETTLPVPVFATEDGCLLYLFWELLQSGRV